MADKVKSPCLDPDKLREVKRLNKLSSPTSVEELRILLSKISDENPISEELFKEHYQIFIVEDFLPWQEPLGKLYEKAIAICSVKPKKNLEKSNIQNEVFSEDNGCPLSNLFQEISRRNSKSSRSHSVIAALKRKYELLPLSQNIGKKILSMCKAIEVEHFQNMPVIAICHGERNKSAILLGSFPHKNSSMIITTQGLIKKEQQLVRLSVLKESHLQGFPASFSSIDTSVFAKYEFLQRETKKKSILKLSKDTNVFMECWWNDASALLEPLTSTCLCFAKIQAIGGNRQTGACSIFKELQKIETLQNGFQTGVITWSKSKGDGYILKCIEELIKKQMTAKPERPSGIPDFSDDELKCFDIVISDERFDLDFSEKLWLILKDVTSFEELKAALTFVYKALEDLSYPPYVYKKNMSSIALFVKNMKDKSIACPDMTPKDVLKQLVEIGIAKLRRDYVTIFLSLGLITFENVSHFLQPELVSTEAVNCLKQLHTVLELTIVCRKHLCFSKTLLSEFIRSTLKHYTCVPDVDLSHVFTFQLPTVKARQLLNPLRPTIWEISFVSNVDGFMKQSIHRYVTKPTVEHICAPENFHPREMLKTASYVYTTSTLIEDTTFEDD